MGGHVDGRLYSGGVGRQGVEGGTGRKAFLGR